MGLVQGSSGTREADAVAIDQAFARQISQGLLSLNEQSQRSVPTTPGSSARAVALTGRLGRIFGEGATEEDLIKSLPPDTDPKYMRAMEAVAQRPHESIVKIGKTENEQPCDHDDTPCVQCSALTPMVARQIERQRPDTVRPDEFKSIRAVAPLLATPPPLALALALALALWLLNLPCTCDEVLCRATHSCVQVRINLNPSTDESKCALCPVATAQSVDGLLPLWSPSGAIGSSV